MTQEGSFPSKQLLSQSSCRTCTPNLSCPIQRDPQGLEIRHGHKIHGTDTAGKAKWWHDPGTRFSLHRRTAHEAAPSPAIPRCVSVLESHRYYVLQAPATAKDPLKSFKVAVRGVAVCPFLDLPPAVTRSWKSRRRINSLLPFFVLHTSTM